MVFKSQKNLTVLPLNSSEMKHKKYSTYVIRFSFQLDLRNFKILKHNMLKFIFLGDQRGNVEIIDWVTTIEKCIKYWSRTENIEKKNCTWHPANHWHSDNPMRILRCTLPSISRENQKSPHFFFVFVNRLLEGWALR